MSEAVHAYINETGDWSLPLIAGDDYELCFTVSQENAARLSSKYVKIGFIEAKQGLRISKAGIIKPFLNKGYEHFS